MEDYIIVYEKPSGEIFERKRKSYPLDRVGDKTNNGWVVLAVRFPYKGKYVTKDEYFDMIRLDQQIIQRRYKIKKWLYENTLKVLRIAALLILIEYIISK